MVERICLVAAFLCLALPCPAQGVGPRPSALRQILSGELAPEQIEGLDEPPQDTTPEDSAPAPHLPLPTAAQGPASESLSLGYPAAGSLEGAVAFPNKSLGFHFLEVIAQRGTGWGTRELLGLIERAGRALDAAFPGSVFRVGNVSRRGGGAIQWSVSHRCGRDVDILFLVDDARGRALPVRDFESFGPDGRSRRDRARHFSVPRNWALVRALVMDERSPVQRIFIADWLREALLAHASASPGDAEAHRRAVSVLAQPRYARDHSDHYHVRVFCTLDDALQGCHDYEPRWDWVEDWAPQVRKRAAALAASLAHDEPAERIATLKTLRRLEARQTAPSIAPRLDDPDHRVRRAALDTLSAFGHAALDHLPAALPRQTDPHWAAELIRALAGTQPGRHAKLLERLLRKPERALPKLPAEAPLAPARTAAAEALGRVGRKASAEALHEALGDDDPALRSAAAAALAYLTNHDLGGRWDARSSEKSRARQRLKWRRWLDAHSGNDRAQWVRLGFKRKGIVFRGAMLSERSVPTLISALGRGGHLAHNATRTLRHILGEGAPAYCGQDEGCWRKWWRRR